MTIFFPKYKCDCDWYISNDVNQYLDRFRKDYNCFLTREGNQLVAFLWAFDSSI